MERVGRLHHSGVCVAGHGLNRKKIEELDIGSQTHNGFKCVPMHEVHGFVAKLGMHHPVEIQKENLHG